MHRAVWGMSLLALASQAAPPDPAPAATGDAPHESPWWSLADSKAMQSLGVDSWSQVMRPGTWTSTLDASFNANQQNTESTGTPTKDFTSRLISEGVTVRNQGFAILDRRLLTGSIGVRFGFDQAQQDAGGVHTAQHGDLTDYYADLALLPEKPYNGTFAASHTEAMSSQQGGSTTNGVYDSETLAFNWREDSFLRDMEIAPYFSAILQARHEHAQQVTNSAAQTYRRDEERSSLLLDGQNGFETADLSFRLEDLDVKNIRYPDQSYQGQNADVTYSGDFGEYLDRHADTHFNYNERSGRSIDVSNLTLDQRLSVDHTDFLSTNYGYAFFLTETPEGNIESNSVDAGAAYSPFLNLTTGTGAFATHETYPSGNIDTYGSNADASYQNVLPGNGQLLVSLGGGLQLNESNMTSSRVPVIDQDYQAPPELGAGAGFTLDATNVDASTIIVIDVRDGARLPTTEGVDYEIEQVGSETRILPLPTSAVILPGDPLEVSYLYFVDPDLRSRTTMASGSVVADWHWIGVALTHDQTNQTALTPGVSSNLLADKKRDTLRVDLRRDWGAINARADGKASRYRDTNLQYDELRFGQNLTYRPSYYWQLGLIGSQVHTNYTSTDRRTVMNSVRLNASWTTESGWWGDAYVSHRTLDDTRMASEKVTDGLLKIRRNWLKLDVSMTLGFGIRQRGNVETTSGSISLNAVRRF